jgi:FkbM family methyltransferase
VRVAVRHRTRDVDVFDETFTGRPSYEPPPEVALLLTDGLRVLDLGGNVGLFGAWVLERLPNARITSIEPDPINLPVIRACIAANSGRWELIEACASVALGTVSFEGGQYADSHMVTSPTDRSIDVPAIDVFPFLNASDFVKIDIEGAEWPILTDPRFRAVTPAAIVLEWHEADCPSDDAHRTAVAALTGAGYRTWGDSYGYPHGVLWGWRDGAAHRP